MKRMLPTALMLGLLGAVLAADKAKSNAATESEQMRRRIDALLKPRRSPPPLPLDPPNPFVPPATAGGASVSPGANATAGNANPSVDRPVPPRDDASATSTELLARFASRLKITGLIRLKDQVHVIINDSPWREGDFIIVDRSSRIIQLQVVRIQTGLLTLRLDDAELVLRF